MEEFMKAQELALYFTNKFGKPIAFMIDETDIGGSFSADLTYTVGPIAVSDENVLHGSTISKIRSGSTAAIPS
jgi:hypothetical protein